MAAEGEHLLHRYPVLSDIIARLVGAFRPERIYLFGSQARGDASDQSDFDLLMVVSQSSLPRYRRDQAAFRALDGVGVSKDIIVFTREEFDRKRTVVCSLPATVEREGVLLYGT